MSTYHLGLWFREMPVGALPGPPLCHVYVKTPLAYEYPDADGVVFLTPREFGPTVLESQIDDLISELQAIKAEARRRYAAHDRRRVSRRPAE